MQQHTLLKGTVDVCYSLKGQLNPLNPLEQNCLLQKQCQSGPHSTQQCVPIRWHAENSTHTLSAANNSSCNAITVLKECCGADTQAAAVVWQCAKNGQSASSATLLQPRHWPQQHPAKHHTAAACTTTPAASGGLAQWRGCPGMRGALAACCAAASPLRPPCATNSCAARHSTAEHSTRQHSRVSHPWQLWAAERHACSVMQAVPCKQCHASNSSPVCAPPPSNLTCSAGVTTMSSTTCHTVLTSPLASLAAAC
jgi:hypothetical protein